MELDTQPTEEASSRGVLPLEDSLETRPLIAGGTQGPLGKNGQNGWQLILNDPHRRCFMSYKPSGVARTVLDAWYYSCVNDLKWERPWVNQKLLPRKACWLTMPNVRVPYKYGGREWACQIMPEWLQQITKQIGEICGLTDPPNSCNANMYETGEDVVGWHADDEPLFKANEQDALIISLSLGTSRIFAYRPNDNPDQARRQLLADGDLCVMEGLMQKYYKHAVPRAQEVVGPRINLTWRWIV